jgi:hypothetical protein
VLGLFVLPAFVVGTVAGPHAERGPGVCADTTMLVVDYAQEPEEQDFDSPRVGRYRNLSAAERRYFDRASRALGTPVQVTEREWRRADSIPDIVVRNDSVYRFQLGLRDCPLVPGVPPSFNHVFVFYLRIHDLLTGPLAPLLVVSGGIGVAAWAGKRIEY